MAQRFPQDPHTLPSATLGRRMAAMLYDGMLIIAMLVVLTGVYTLAHQGLIDAGVVPDRYADIMETDEIGFDPILFLLLFGSVTWFFGHFWTRTGQTIGMQTWLIRVQNADGTTVTWLQVFMRMLLGIASWLPLGLGFFWVLLDRNKLTWTDRFSDSVTVRVPTPEGRKSKKEKAREQAEKDGAKEHS
ncbi:MAG: RDD family protein [Halomonadaceae bacterium]|nr:MAG: RDD family protein [Halomonadaceae bacterium]